MWWPLGRTPKEVYVGQNRLLVIDGWWNHQPVGKVVQPLQSVNCHDSHAHGHERHGPFTWLVGVWLGWFWLGLTGSSWFGSLYAAGAKPVCMVLDVATGGIPVSSVGFGYRWNACELYWFGYRCDACELYWFWLQVGCLWALVSLATRVTPVSWWP
jgi:hypothetical protein